MSVSDLTNVLGLGASIMIAVLGGGFWVLNVRIANLLAMIAKLQEKAEAHAIEIERLKSKGNDD